MNTCLVLESESFGAETLGDLDESSWELADVTDVSSVSGRIDSAAERGVVLYRGGLEPARRGRLYQQVRRAGDRWPMIAAVAAGAGDRTRRELQGGADDVVSMASVRSDRVSDELRLRLERIELDRRTRPRDESFRERTSELLGVNAVTESVSQSLDRQAVARRGLWVFCGMCQRDCAAFFELTPPPPVDDTVRQAGDPPRLECVTTFSAEGPVPLGTVELDDAWSKVVFDDEFAVLDSPPPEGTFTGLAPYWDERPDGRVMLVPLQSNRGPVGVLVLADGRVGSGHPATLTERTVRAMGDQFAAAFENARLFERVRETSRSLEQTQDKLVHAEKYAAVGVMAAEIAHEINDPASFVISNLSVMSEYASELDAYLDEVEERLPVEFDGASEVLDELRAEFEIEYLKEDMEALLSRSLSGMQRVHQIVQDLRYLSRDTGAEPGWVDVENLLDASVNLVRHEAKYRARLEKDYDHPPQVLSDPSRLSQVFLNLLVYAVHAVEPGEVDENEIRVATREVGETVRVAISDTGGGIPEDERDQLFEPVFSTSPSDRAGGLGLSVSRDIVESLGGELEFETEIGRGTTFRLSIPIRADAFEDDEELANSGFYDTPPEFDQIVDDGARPGGSAE
ncbi:MAG: sensor histidine kinase [Bradymonadaceae bacterium]